MVDIRKIDGARPMLLLLEDNPERLQRFTSTLQTIDPALPLHVLPTARVISLDHVLDPVEGSKVDPGTGWDVTKFLAALSPICPVIVQTSNRERATWMLGEFELGGWEHHRVAPIGDDWIEHDWRRLVRRLLRRGHQ